MRIQIGALACVCLAGSAVAQVRSITVGIDVNSPYGISEPWVMIREGLLRLENIEFVSAQPDRKTGTGEIRTKDGRVPDVDALAKAIRELGAGASLRGAEVIVDGILDKRGDQFVLRVAGTDQVLALEPATQRVELRTSVSDADTKAFAELIKASGSKPIAVRITGPLLKRSRAGQPAQAVQVRQFQFQGGNQGESK
jgi:hypothetical protein